MNQFYVSEPQDGGLRRFGGKMHLVHDVEAIMAGKACKGTSCIKLEREVPKRIGVSDYKYKTLIYEE